MLPVIESEMLAGLLIHIIDDLKTAIDVVWSSSGYNVEGRLAAFPLRIRSNSNKGRRIRFAEKAKKTEKLLLHVQNRRKKIREKERKKNTSNLLGPCFHSWGNGERDRL